MTLKWGQLPTCNRGKFGRLQPFDDVKPLNKLDKHPRHKLDATSPAALEDFQGLRIFQDMLLFIPRRYPHARTYVLANMFTTLGAAYAYRAGVSAEDVAAFAVAEYEKIKELDNDAA